MYPYDEYRLSHHNAMRHYRRIQWLGLLPIGTALLLFYARTDEPGPGLWSALGAGVALEMILWSAYAEYQNPRGRTPWANRWMQGIDRWFPYLLVVMQGGFTGIALCLLWFSFCDLGYPATTFQHILFLLLIIVIPARRMLHVDDASERIEACDILNQFFHYLTIVLATLLVTTSILYLVFPVDHPYITEVPLPAMLIWVPAIVICAGCAALFTDYVVRKRKLAIARNTGNHANPGQ